MAAMLCDIVVIAGLTRPRSMPSAMLTMEKELHALLFLRIHLVLLLLCYCLMQIDCQITKYDESAFASP